MGKIIGLIPARGGSKGIPYKSVTLCAGKPLISYTATAALTSKLLDHVIVSTDDEKIRTVAIQCGLSAPFIRPKELSQDNTMMSAVIQHAYHYLLSQGEDIDAILLLQPTSPLRTAYHIDEAIALYRAKPDRTLVSVVKVPHNFHPYSVMRVEDGALFVNDRLNSSVLLRQAKPLLYARNGPAILILPKDKVLSGEFYSEAVTPYIMDAKSSVDVDEIEDLKIASMLIRENANELAVQ